MQIIISTKNISLDKALDVFVRQKIGGLSKFLKDPNDLIEVRVEIGKPSRHHRSGRVYYAEINIKIGSKLLRAACQHEDLRNAVNDVKNELQVQIKKFKGRRADLVKRHQK